MTHQGLGLSAGSSAVVQPVQVLPWKIKGKLHSSSYIVRQVEVLEETPEVIANERWVNNGKSKQ